MDLAQISAGDVAAFRHADGGGSEGDDGDVVASCGKGHSCGRPLGIPLAGPPLQQPPWGWLSRLLVTRRWSAMSPGYHPYQAAVSLADRQHLADRQQQRRAGARGAGANGKAGGKAGGKPGKPKAAKAAKGGKPKVRHALTCLPTHVPLCSYFAHCVPACAARCMHARAAPAPPTQALLSL